MSGIKGVLSIIVSVYCLSGCVNNQTNWNQYLGPDRNASITDGEILKSWSEGKPIELWSFPLGEGYGGASIFDDEVFILDRIKGEKDILRCIDLHSGEEKWNYSYDASGEIPFPGSRAVPTVDNSYVWCVGPHGDFYCFDRISHEPLWNYNLLKEFDGELSTWGVSQSPVIYKDLVIVSPQGSRAGVVAYHKVTGELVWESRPLSGHDFHVSPTIANYGGTDQVIMISPYDRRDSTKTHEVVAFDVDTGEELWSYDGLRSFATITPATVIDDHRLFLSDCSFDGGYDPVSIMLDITKVGEKFIVEEVFLTEEAGSKMHPGVVYEDHLYLNSTGNPSHMQCVTMDGKIMWNNKSSQDFELGAMILVDELILNQNGKNGDIHLIEPSPNGYKELGKASYFASKKSQAWSPLAFSQGKLIIRDLEKMVCLDLQNLE